MPSVFWMAGSDPPKFVKVMPIDYKRVLAERKAAAAKFKVDKRASSDAQVSSNPGEPEFEGRETKTRWVIRRFSEIRA